MSSGRSRDKTRTDTQLTGSAGEFLVAGELARRMWVPSITPRGVERTDILAQHSSSGRVIALQVKTANSDGFQLSAKAEAPTSESNQWFVFVRLADPDDRPRYFVVPANVVSALVFVVHRDWTAGRRRDGSPRKPTTRRVIRANQFERYEDAWQLLEAPSHDAPVWLPDSVLRKSADPAIGLPDGHPGLPPA